MPESDDLALLRRALARASAIRWDAEAAVLRARRNVEREAREALRKAEARRDWAHLDEEAHRGP